MKHRLWTLETGRLLGATVLSLALVAAACGNGDTEAQGGATQEDLRTEAAQQVVDDASAPQEEWNGPTEAPKPQDGVSIGIIPCGLAIEGCARLARGAEEAAQEIGWDAEVVDGQGDPQVIQGAMDSLINRNVDAIVLAAVNAQDIGPQLERAKAEGVKVVGTFSGEPSSEMKPDPWIGMVGIDDTEAGRTLAAYVVANGGGGVAIFTQNESPRVAMRGEGFEAGLKEFAGDSVEIVEERSIPNTQLGPPEQQIMSALLARQPEGTFKWIYAGFDFMITPLIQTAEQTGRTELRGLSFDANLENLEFIRQSRIQAATIGYPLEWAGWAAVDQLNRALQDEPVLGFDETGIRFKLITKENLPPQGESWTGDLDFRSEYRDLWGL
jgi:ribose transport system substrate-binding protein